MDLTKLTNAELLERLPRLCAKEREATLDVLYHLIELDKRRLFLEAGYPSLFEYCRRKLLYSEGGAQRRIMAARCLRDNPSLGKLLLDGQVTLCTIATAASAIRAQATKIEEIAGKSQREVQALVALVNPAPKPRESIKPVVSEPIKAPLLPQAPVEERYELKFSVPKKVYQNFQEARARLSNTLGANLTLEAVFTKLLEQYLAGKKPRASSSASATRYIPAAVKREVYARDDGQCSYVAADGTRCNEKHYLNYDHVTPFGLGGKTESSNLRLLCSRHNRQAAEEVFGNEFMTRAASPKNAANVGGTLLPA